MLDRTAVIAADRYRRLLESAPAAILIVENGTVQFANEAARRLWGVPQLSLLLGRAPDDLFARTSRTGIIRARIVAPESAVAAAEALITRPDGTERVVDVETSAIADDDGGAVALFVRDVTASRQGETSLRESEERLRLAFAGAQEGVWDWNLETGVVIYSRRWKEMLGYRHDEIPPDVRAWESLLHPDDKDYADTLYDRVQRGQQIYAGEFRLRHRDGHYITVLSRGLPIRGDAGQLVRIVGTHLDITERKRTELALRQSEERLTLAFAGAQEGIWDWDLETDAVVYSSRWKQMLGYRDEEIEPHISAWERLVHPADRPAADRAHEIVMRGQPTYDAEFRLRHKDGHYVHVLSRGFPVRRDPGGPVIRIVGTHFDLTPRREREAERARTELLAHLVTVQEEERKRIARDMHDQFGEHLSALSLQIARLKDAPAASDVRQHAETLDAIAGRLDHDVEQLVWQLRPTALDDLGLRAALANYLQGWSQHHHVATELHTSGLLDHRLAPELETALYRIAQEALNNAAKHARAQRVEVILERRPDCVLLIVEDDGVGFEPPATGNDGHGFGLVGMKERAALVGASLDVESTPGVGTTVLVRMDVSGAPHDTRGGEPR